MTNDRLPEFNSERISFYISYDRGNKPVHTHTKVLLVDNVPQYGMSWRESESSDGINENEPSNYEVYMGWVMLYSSKNNGGICWD